MLRRIATNVVPRCLGPDADVHLDVSKRDHVTVQGSFTEEFFTPEVVMKSELYRVIQPDGKSVKLTPVYTRDLAVLEVATTTAGTYRISSGQREGRTAKAVFINGEWEFLEPGTAPPAGTTPVDMKSLTKADVYVTRGGPSQAALSPSGSGLEFRGVTHPNSIFVGAPAQLEVLFDGKPLANQPISISASVTQRRPCMQRRRAMPRVASRYRPASPACI